MRTTRLPAGACPACRRPMDAATSVDSEVRPKAGDLSLCGACGAFLVFRDDLTVRAIREDEWQALPQHVRAEMFRLQTGLRLLRGEAFDA